MVSTWIVVFILLLLLTAILSGMFYILEKSGVDVDDQQNYSSPARAISSGITLCLRASVRMDFDNGMTSYTSKIILFTTLTLGFIIFSHYESIFASILIVQSEIVPYKSWLDVDESGKTIFVWEGTSDYDMFQNAKDITKSHWRKKMN